jgi:hypothetical protein
MQIVSQAKIFFRATVSLHRHTPHQSTFGGFALIANNFSDWAARRAGSG